MVLLPAAAALLSCEPSHLLLFPLFLSSGARLLLLPTCSLWNYFIFAKKIKCKTQNVGKGDAKPNMAQFILIIVHYNGAASLRCALRLFSFPCLHIPPSTRARLLIYNKKNYVVPTTNPFLKIYSDFFFSPPHRCRPFPSHLPNPPHCLGIKIQEERREKEEWHGKNVCILMSVCRRQGGY